MGLKLYYDLFSQPSRAVYIFMKVCNIPFESKLTKIQTAEHLSPEYEKINPFKKVPAIEHDGFKLSESVAILRYLCREFKVADSWYPASSKDRAKVDEYLEWQHLNTRLHCATYFLVTFLNPLFKGRPAKPEKVQEHLDRMEECLNQLENIWLKDRPFLTGNRITIADILGACEVEQPRIAGFDPRDGRPRLTEWLKRVEKETSPYYEEAHKPLNMIASKSKQSPPKTASML